MALKRVVYLTDSEYGTLKSTGSVTIGGQTYTPSAETEFRVIAKDSKLYRHNVMVQAQTMSYGVQLSFVSPYPYAIDDADLFEDYAPMVMVGAYVNDSSEYGNVTVYVNSGHIMIMGRNVLINEDIFIQEAVSNYVYLDSFEEMQL